MNENLLVRQGLRRLLEELVDGPAADQYAWVLNPGTCGLMDTLKRLSAAESSAVRVPGRSSIAAHANHLRFSLELLNRKSNGEPPFPDEEWAASWSVQTVTDGEWSRLLARLQAEAGAWMNHVASSDRAWGEEETMEALASSAHIAYHFGAIRQLLGITAQ